MHGPGEKFNTKCKITRGRTLYEKIYIGNGLPVNKEKANHLKELVSRN